MMVDATQKDLDQDRATRRLADAIDDFKLKIGSDIGMLRASINDQSELITKLTARVNALAAENEITSRDIFDIATHLITLTSHVQLKQGLVPLDIASLNQIRAKRT